MRPCQCMYVCLYDSYAAPRRGRRQNATLILERYRKILPIGSLVLSDIFSCTYSLGVFFLILLIFRSIFRFRDDKKLNGAVELARALISRQSRGISNCQTHGQFCCLKRRMASPIPAPGYLGNGSSWNARPSRAHHQYRSHRTYFAEVGSAAGGGS